MGVILNTFNCCHENTLAYCSEGLLAAVKYSKVLALEVITDKMGPKLDLIKLKHVKFTPWLNIKYMHL
jgi:hypothetical protein